MSGATREEIFAGYARAATPKLIRAWETIDHAELFAGVWEHLPRSESRVLDVGAGTGRDAAVFAKQGCVVTAVEPVSALRDIGRRLQFNKVTERWALRGAGWCSSASLHAAPAILPTI